MLLRAELDALPLKEDTGADYASIPRQTVSEDFSKIPDAAGVRYTYWGIGFTDRETYLASEKAGRLEDLPAPPGLT